MSRYDQLPALKDAHTYLNGVIKGLRFAYHQAGPVRDRVRDKDRRAAAHHLLAWLVPLNRQLNAYHQNVSARHTCSDFHRYFAYKKQYESVMAQLTIRVYREGLEGVVNSLPPSVLALALPEPHAETEYHWLVAGKPLKEVLQGLGERMAANRSSYFEVRNRFLASLTPDQVALMHTMLEKAQALQWVGDRVVEITARDLRNLKTPT